MALTQKQYLGATGLTAFWNKIKKYINDEDTKAATAIDTKINSLTIEYNSDAKTISLKSGEVVLSSFDATNFVKDSFLKSGKLVDKDGKKYLELTLNTVERPGTTPVESVVEIDVTRIFEATASNVILTDGTTVEEAVSSLKTESVSIKNAATTLTTRVATLEGSKDDYKAADTAVYDAITAIPTEYISGLFAEGGS